MCVYERLVPSELVSSGLNLASKVSGLNVPLVLQTKFFMNDINDEDSCGSCHTSLV